MKKYTFKLIYTFYFALIGCCSLLAQIPGDENDTGNLEGTDTPSAPIDNLLLILALAGIVFAFYHFRKNKKAIQ
ncbi:hypothetical protein [Flavobacterium turcicum]|uniref:Signal peptidase n=1 Tax=Flavobacterium turcicum TaxID=2764718 RepID=A0ABR7JGB7_9FLAO|nr:hypothetical protein [Flavobacterium turcicum]MBC5863512.1 hypothetical protein [Flavobacterium turcicum]NHL02538.1 hypothetical protein [Flavobacterium turcicum]